MVEMQKIEVRVAPVATRVAARQGCELVDCKYVNDGGRWFLRVYIDREGGVTIGDCSSVSRQMSAILDVEDFIPPAYHLEVSSPGLDRPLNTPDDYQRFSGEPIKIRTAAPVHGRRRFRGTLDKFENETVTLTDSNGEVFEIPLDKVRSARLDPQI